MGNDLFYGKKMRKVINKDKLKIIIFWDWNMDKRKKSKKSKTW